MTKGLASPVPEPISKNLPLELFERLAMRSPHGYIINDCSRVGNPIIFVNDAFKRITGYESEDVLERSNRLLLLEDTDQEPLETLRQAITRGEQCTVTLRNYRKNGSLFYNELTMVDTCKDSAGNETHRLWCIRDVTESVKKQTESAFKIIEMEERFSAYLENSNEAIWQLDFEPPISIDIPEITQVEQVFERGVFTEANDVAAKIYGYSKGEEIIGRFLSDFMVRANADNARHLTDLVQNRFTIDNLISFEQRSDDSTLVILNNIRPTVKEGKVHSVWGTSIEISELFKAQENLKASEEQLEAQKLALREKNIALKVLLNQVEEEKRELTERVLANVEHVLIPSVKRIKLNRGEDVFIDQHMIALKNLTSSFGRKITGNMVKLSPREMEVCSLVRNGMVNKEIADMLSIAVHTVEKHRRVVRKKLGIANKGINLHSYLNSL